jgi:hypothetical protein
LVLIVGNSALSTKSCACAAVSFLAGVFLVSGRVYVSMAPQTQQKRMHTLYLCHTSVPALEAIRDKKNGENINLTSVSTFSDLRMSSVCKLELNTFPHIYHLITHPLQCWCTSLECYLCQLFFIQNIRISRKTH